MSLYSAGTLYTARLELEARAAAASPSTSSGSSYTSGWSDIAHEVFDAEWLTAEQIWQRQQASSSGGFERFQPNAPIIGQNIPFGRGAIKTKGKPIWAEPAKKDSKGKIVVSFVMSFFHNTFQKSQKLTRIVFDDTVIYDTDRGGVIGNQPEGYNKMRIYTGIDNPVDPMMLARDGVNRTPNYDGHCMVAFENWDVTDFGHRMPIVMGHWADSISRVGTQFSFDLLPRPDSDPYILCYDGERGFAYLGDNVGVDAYVGVSNFNQHKEKFRTKVTGFPEVEIGVLENAIPLKGTAYILCTTTAPVSGKHYDLLIHAETAVIEAYLDRGANLVQWMTAQLLDTQYTMNALWIAGGNILNPTPAGTYPIAWLSIDLATKTLAYISFGETITGSGDNPVFLSPKRSTSSGAVFYDTRQYSGSDHVTQLTFVDGSSPQDSVIASAADIKGFIGYDRNRDKVAFTVEKSGTSYLVYRDAENIGSVVQDSELINLSGKDYAVMGEGGGWDGSFQTIIPDTRPDTVVLVEIDPGTDFANPHTPILYDLPTNQIFDIPAGTHIYSQSLLTAFTLDAVGNKWDYTVINDIRGDLVLNEILVDLTTYTDRYEPGQITTVNVDDIFVKAVYMSQGGSVVDFIKRICNLFSVNIVERNSGISYIRKSAITANLE